MELVLILAFVTFIGWGTGDIFSVISTRKIGPLSTTFWVFFFSTLFSILLLPIAPVEYEAVTLSLIFFNALFGLFFLFGNLLILEAFRISSAPLVGIIIQAYPALVLIFSAIFFREMVSPIQWLWIVVIFAGVTLCSVDFSELRSTNKLIDRGTGLALIAALLLAIFFTFSRVFTNTYGWFLPILIAQLGFPVMLFFLRRNRERLHVPKSKSIWVSVILAALLIRGADFALNYGLSIPNASGIVAPIASAAPVLFVLLSYYIFKDKLAKQQVAGIVTALVGVLMLAQIS